MGATIISSTASASSSVAGASSSVTSLLSPVGAGVGGIVVAALLVCLLAHLDLLSAQPDPDSELQRTLIAAIIPLGLTFAGIVTFHSLQVI